MVALALAGCGQINAQNPDAGARDATATDAGARDADPTACLPVNSTVLDPTSAGIPTLGLVVWLRADAGVSVTPTGEVCSWKNQVGKEVFRAENAVFLEMKLSSPQLVTDWMPGIPALRSGPNRGLGASSVESVPATAGRTFFSVTERVDATGRFQPIMHGLPTSNFLYVGLDQNSYNTVGRRYGAYVSGGSFDASFSIQPGARAVESLVVDNLTVGSASASILHYFNNGSSATLTYLGNLMNVSDMSLMTTTYVACSQTGTVLQPEALIYARPLSEAERRQVERYLAARYGIPL